MAGPYREKIFAVSAALETTSGVDASPTLTSNAVRVSGVPELTLSDLESGDRGDMAFGDFGTIDRAAPAGSYGTITLMLELAGAGGAYSSSVRPPNGLDVLLQAANMVESHDYTGGAEKVQYTTLRTGGQTMTLYCYTGNIVFKLVGCVAVPKMDIEAAKRGMISFAVTGKFSAYVDSGIGSITTNEVVPPLFHSALVSIGSWTSADGSEPLVLRKIGLDWGMTVEARPGAGAADGLIGYIITDQKLSQTATVERVSIAKFDPEAIAKSTGSVTNTKTTFQIGTAQYNRVKFSLGQWMINRPKRTSQNGLLTWDLAGAIKQYSEPIKSRDITITFD